MGTEGRKGLDVGFVKTSVTWLITRTAKSYSTAKALSLSAMTQRCRDRWVRPAEDEEKLVSAPRSKAVILSRMSSRMGLTFCLVPFTEIDRVREELVDRCEKLVPSWSPVLRSLVPLSSHKIPPSNISSESLEHRRKSVRQGMIQPLDISASGSMDVIHHYFGRDEFRSSMGRHECFGELLESGCDQLVFGGEDDGTSRTAGQGGQLRAESEGHAEVGFAGSAGKSADFSRFVTTSGVFAWKATEKDDLHGSPRSNLPLPS